MKKHILIGLLILFAALSNTAKGQIFLGEAFVGLNLCQVDGDQMMGFFKKGINVGVGVIAPIWKKDKFSLELSMEVLYNQKGALQGRKYFDNKIDPVTGVIITGEYNLTMSYGEVPFMVYFTDKNLVSAGVGVSYARLMGLKEYEHGVRTAVTATSGEYDQNEYNILADVKIRVYKRFKLGFRYSYSLNSIRTRTYHDIEGNYIGTFNQHNNLFTLRLTYVFNEKPENLQREEYQYTGNNPKFNERKVQRQLKKLRRKQEREAKKKKND